MVKPDAVSQRKSLPNGVPESLKPAGVGVDAPEDFLKNPAASGFGSSSNRPAVVHSPLPTPG
jgi:hypothetical protein